MNRDFLPAVGNSLRALAQFATWREVTDETLTEIAAELDRARTAVAAARGQQRANKCLRHLGGPVDPTADNGCLLCGGPAQPERPIEAASLVEVLRYSQEHGEQAAVERYGGRALIRAQSLDAHPSNPHADRTPHQEESTE